MKSLLGLPADLGLPTDPVRAHRRDPALDLTLDEAAVRALRRWYRRDYRLLRFCVLVGGWRRWGPAPPPGRRRVRYEVRRLSFPLRHLR